MSKMPWSKGNTNNLMVCTVVKVEEPKCSLFNQTDREVMIV